MRGPALSVALAAVVVQAGAISCARPAPPSSPDEPFTRLRDEYFLRTLQANPVTSTYLGGDGYSTVLADANGRLRDYSPQTIAAQVAADRQTRDALHAIDSSALTAPLRLDYELMDSQLEFVIHQNAERKYYQRAVDTYIAEPFRGLDWQIQGMADQGGDLRGTEAEWKLVVSRLDAVPRYFEIARVSLLAGRQTGNLPDKRMVQRDGIDGAAADADYFRNILQHTAASAIGSRPFGGELRARLKQSGDRAAAAAEEFATFLNATYNVSEGLDRYAVGAAEYEWRVRTAFHDKRNAAELYEYGAQQVAMYESRMIDVARRIFDDQKLGLRFRTEKDGVASVRAVLAYLSKDSPASDDQLFQWYHEAADRAVAYGRSQAMFDVPSDYKLDILPTPHVLRGSVDAAYYPAPIFKKSGVGRFYLSPTGNDPAALKVNNRASIADTAVHEGFPGHDWQFKFMTEHASEISNVRWLLPATVEDSSAMWSDSLTTEGWGLYAEELMSEPSSSADGHPYGFYTPAEYLYRLQGQMMRAVRIRVDVGIHTGRMTFDAARDYYAEHVDFLPNACIARDRDPIAKAVCETADRAVYRYSKWPTQAISYNLGKNAIVALRDAYKRAMGAHYSARAFHEQFLKAGEVPASMELEAVGKQ